MSPAPSPVFLRAQNLRHPCLAHAFFTRHGGVSTGVHTSLNGSFGSKDVHANVVENRARMAHHLGVAASHLLIPHLVHSPDCATVEEPFDHAHRPICDGLATRARGLALGVTGADCGMIVFADAERGVIGAAHAGWRGALNGVLEATVEAMIKLGARRSHIAAALGPVIRHASYAVGAEFEAQFLTRDKSYQRFFAPSPSGAPRHFDLPAFIAQRLARAGIADFEDLHRDTYSEADDFFSYRRSVHRKEADYGRHVSAIVLL